VELDFKIISLEEVIKQLDNLNIWTEIHVHHTWKPEKADFNGNNHIALQIAMHNYHVNVKKWDKIAQHYTLFPDGKFVTGRPLTEMPISIYNHNKVGALAIEMVGNFDKGHEVLEGQQKLSILKLCKYFLDKNLKIVFHRDFSEKTCPGSGIDKEIFIQEVKNLSLDENIFKDFSEVPEWAKDTIKYAKEIGLIQGNKDGYFMPNDPITRTEAVVIIVRAINYLENKLKGDS